METKVTGIKKWARDLNRDFPKEDVQLTDGYMKGVHERYITDIREMQIKTTVTYHLTHVRMAFTKNN